MYQVSYVQQTKNRNLLETQDTTGDASARHKKVLCRLKYCSSRVYRVPVLLYNIQQPFDFCVMTT